MSAPALRPRTVALALAGAAVALLLVANAHLVYVAVLSQPDCVPHLKTESHAAGTYRAARPSC